MKKIIVSEWITLDGVFDASTMNEWFNPYDSKARAQYISAGVHDADVFLMGRVTYDMLAPFWSQAKQNEMGIGDKMNSMPKYVVTSHELKTAWQNTHILHGDISAQVKELKTLPGNGHIRVTGSADVVRQLMEADLIDEYRMLVHPVIMGKGKHFYSDRMQERLELLSMRPIDKGVVLLTYRPTNINSQTAKTLPNF